MKNEIIKVVAATVLCLGLFGVAFIGINNIVLAAAAEGTQPLQIASMGINDPVANEVPVLREGYQKPELTVQTIIASDTTPSTDEVTLREWYQQSIDQQNAKPAINALTPEAAAEIGAQYIWHMFGESIDGQTVLMTYSCHPAMTRAYWIGSVSEPEAFLLVNREISLEERQQYNQSKIFTFSVDAITGEWIDIYTNSHWQEMSPKVMDALTERFNTGEGRLAEEAMARRYADALFHNASTGKYTEDEYTEAAREIAQRHFTATEVASIELSCVNAIAYDLDEKGNPYIASLQLVYAVTDNTGRIADIAMVAATKQLIWLNTSSNDIIPRWVYVGAEADRG